MIQANDLLTLVKILGEQKGSLKTKKIIIQGEQVVMVKVGTEFSFKQWLRNIGKDEIGWNFSFDLGRSAVYGRQTLHDNARFIMLELAITGLQKQYALTTPSGKMENYLVREDSFMPLQYVEVTDFL